MELSFKIGTRTETVRVPDEAVLGVLEPNEVPVELTGRAEVCRALAQPIGTPRLGQIVRPGEKVAIVTSDITRPMPTWTVLPPVLEELYGAGVRPEDITLVFALGSHRKHTPEEMAHLAGERAWGQIRCVDLDVNDCIHVGTTSRGTPVDIDRRVAETDRRICLGNIEYHYFAGYSGGAKAIMPGVSTRNAIQANHCRMVEAAACAGKLTGNPVREDIEEAAAMVVLIGSCREGLGEKVFEQWLTRAPTPHSLIDRIQKEFRLGGHKAAAIAMVLETADIYLVSDLEDDLVRSLFMTPFHTVQAAYDAAAKRCGSGATVLAMPYGGSTLPWTGDLETEADPRSHHRETVYRKFNIKGEDDHGLRKRIPAAALRVEGQAGDDAPGGGGLQGVPGPGLYPRRGPALPGDPEGYLQEL